MAIRSIEFEDFTAFRNAKLALSPGINVLIGENATGKTHAMKALYSVVRAMADSPTGQSTGQKLAAVFRPDDGSLGRLGRRRPGQRTARVTVRDDRGGSCVAAITTKTSDCRTKVVRAWHGPTKSVFLPSREGLAMFEGFIAAYSQRELAFDETYYDLVVALSAAALRGTLPTALLEIGGDLEKALGGKVVLKGPRFYVRGTGGFLCWDEPEANLNPRLTVVVAHTLVRLAANRVQIVLATHDHLLTETLALLARSKPDPAIRFFAFTRSQHDEGVTVSDAETLDDLPSNPIRDEYLAHYDQARDIDA